MPTVTLSSKNQITLPVAMVRALGLKAGSKLDIELIDDRLVIWPKPQSYADYFVGSMKGYWGTAEDVDRYVAEERASWERDESYERARDFLDNRRDEVAGLARKIVLGLRGKPGLRANFSEVKRMAAGTAFPELSKALHQLTKEEHQIVRQIGQPEGEAWNNVEFRLYDRFARYPELVP